jgi:hypothetical protein
MKEIFTIGNKKVVMYQAGSGQVTYPVLFFVSCINCDFNFDDFKSRISAINFATDRSKDICKNCNL